MSIITVLPHAELCPDGALIDAKAGISLCDALLKHGIEIEHACEKVAACATCHVYVHLGASTLKAPDEEEEDQLDAAWGLQSSSRLACCARLGAHDITIELPRHTRNLARE
ncbi:MAG TPA: 2Fe-2S iron-sulfur cluster-binding protein [Rhodocyclaceae bacterium]|nr:2Fe-2S iron-sulfur cluster-binding protein [Rhodocyclaceae bacterium]